MSAGALGRFGPPPGVGTDGIRAFHRALELLGSSAGDTDAELLDLVKNAKREQVEKEAVPKKARSARVAGEASSELLQSLGGHRAAAEHAGSSPPAGSDAAAAATANAGGAASGGPAGGGAGNMTQAQARLMHVIRGGAPSRGRIEKPKRKSTR